jgi:glycosyltransferase involved in cell wall biosynthesis
MPKISIILPTYNSKQFLKERMDSILHQTMQDWECIVIDGNSKDGTWDELNVLSKSDSRFKLYQFPPKGPYDAWNKGVERASGEFVYIATSDDTMDLDCLEKLYLALSVHTDCGIAQCALSVIDENSAPIANNWETYPAVQHYGELMTKNSVRYAPYDFVVNCVYHTGTWTSMTQVLIKKQVFDTMGLFLTNVGSIADLEWQMRYNLRQNTIFTPHTKATWRIHQSQTTSFSYFFSPACRELEIKFIRDNLKNSSVGFKSGTSLLIYTYFCHKVEMEMKQGSVLFRVMLRNIRYYPKESIRYIFDWYTKKDLSDSCMLKKLLRLNQLENKEMIV